MDQARPVMSNDQSTVARRLDIFGRVQGVWYRNWAVDAAQDLHLVGWVRNRSDGRVEAWVEGQSDAIARFIALAHDGPTNASVTHITQDIVQPAGLQGFEKRPTV